MTDAPIVASVNLWQSLKALVQIESTEVGMFTDFRLEQ